MSLCKQRQRQNRRSKCTKTEHRVNMMLTKLKADEQHFFVSFQIKKKKKNNDRKTSDWNKLTATVKIKLKTIASFFCE